MGRMQEALEVVSFWPPPKAAPLAAWMRHSPYPVEYWPAEKQRQLAARQHKAKQPAGPPCPHDSQQTGLSFVVQGLLGFRRHCQIFSMFTFDNHRCGIPGILARSGSSWSRVVHLGQRGLIWVRRGSSWSEVVKLCQDWLIVVRSGLSLSEFVNLGQTWLLLGIGLKRKW